jgi:hypothetical protein
MLLAWIPRAIGPRQHASLSSSSPVLVRACAAPRPAMGSDRREKMESRSTTPAAMFGTSLAAPASHRPDLRAAAAGPADGEHSPPSAHFSVFITVLHQENTFKCTHTLPSIPPRKVQRPPNPPPTALTIPPARSPTTHPPACPQPPTMKSPRN